MTLTNTECGFIEHKNVGPNGLIRKEVRQSSV